MTARSPTNVAASGGSRRVTVSWILDYDLVRGIGQLTEALAAGYEPAALVVTMRTARRINPESFDRTGLVPLGVDSKDHVQQAYPTYASSCRL
jgi:hypothetical protein